ncbi:hypothetical protein FEM48_Zijuj09G0207700 [Ziziphus jujuba var. spinosa]|uniref:Uncharacterized protein n=1 Tax=Ziziphus jujuba var. spinosa TaxID=714518 RepID=A0A978UV84_ZIZJJ|nr:hypothetical protein FEM48_Zijuj09G0207700 [Ziziphus jujuba var. spinosa]
MEPFLGKQGIHVLLNKGTEDMAGKQTPILKSPVLCFNVALIKLSLNSFLSFHNSYQFHYMPETSFVTSLDHFLLTHKAYSPLMETKCADYVCVYEMPSKFTYDLYGCSEKSTDRPPLSTLNGSPVHSLIGRMELKEFLCFFFFFFFFCCGEEDLCKLRMELSGAECVLTE